jgi:hypothetical protein
MSAYPTLNENFCADLQLVLKHAVAERFGVRISELTDWAFFSSTKNEVSMMQLHHFPASHMTAGNPNLSWERGAILPMFSRSTMHIISSLATRNIFKLRTAQAELFLGHGQLKHDPSTHRHDLLSSGPVILRHGEATLGMANLSDDGTIINYSRYIELSSYPAVERSQKPKYH